MEYLYHVTLASNLDSIVAHGLLPGRGMSFSGYGGHAKGKLFLTEASAVPCWWDKFWSLSEHHYELEEMIDLNHVPVVLRVDEDVVLDPEEDPLGSQDCREGVSLFIDYEIPADHVEVWNGARWLAVEAADADSVTEAYLPELPNWERAA